MSRTSLLKLLPASLIVLCLAACPAAAQNSLTAPDAANSGNEANAANATDDQPKPQPAGPVADAPPIADITDPADAPLFFTPNLDQPAIKNLGGDGSWFSDNVHLFAWGPVAVRSADFLYGYSSASPQAALSQSFSTADFQANVAYSKRLRRSVLVLQYNPSLIYSNSQLSVAAANQETSFNTLFALAPHVTLGLSEGLNFYGPASILTDKTFTGSGDVAFDNPFLSSIANPGQRTWLESLSAPVTFNATARTTIQVTPSLNYVRTSGDTAVSGEVEQVSLSSPLSDLDFGARVQMSHSLSLNQTIGAFYTYQTERTSGLDGNTVFQSFGASASRRFGRSFTISGEGGGSYATGHIFNEWTFVGSVSVSERFQHSSIDGSFGRDSTFTGLITSDYDNRASANYNRQVGRKITWVAGGGFLDGTILGIPASGKYANARVNYALNPSVSWYCSYVHIWETGPGAQFVNGGQSQLQVGLRWTPRLRPN